MSPKKDTQKSVKSTTATNKKFTGFTDEERPAMKEYLQERKTSTARGPRADKADGESGELRTAVGPLQKASRLRLNPYGTSRTRSWGNKIASRMFGRSSSFWMNRSSPNPQPPCGGMPYRNALR